MKLRFIRAKSITLKLLVPVSLIIMLSITGAGVFSYNQEKVILTDNIGREAKEGIGELINTMESANIAISSVKGELASNYISRAKLVAKVIAADNTHLDIESLKRLSSETGVDEIHITDEKGILKWSTVKEFINYDMASSEQSKAFMPLIKDKSKVIVQEPQERGADKVLFQYIGVPRIDAPGIVQIGVKPEAVKKISDTISAAQNIKNMKLSKTGYFFVLNKDGIAMYHPKDGETGKDVKQFDWGQRILKEKNGDFLYTYNGVEKHVFFKEQNDMFICGTIPTAEYLEPLDKLRFNMGIVTIIAILLSIIVIYFASNTIIIKPLKNIMSLMSKAEKGDLTVRSNIVDGDEIGQLSKSFNIMLSDISGLVKSVFNIVKQVSESADALSATSEETAASTSEITNTIQQIAAGASEGAKNSQLCAEAINSLAEKMDNVAQSSNNMKSASEDSMSLNSKGIEAMKYTAKKFDENVKNAREVGSIVSQLNEKTKGIGEITDTITSIANQTNLLSLNAAIEAARAGESGRGFAVVAEEIRKLAEQSAKGAEEIAMMIEAIKNDTAQAVKSMDAAGKIVEEVNKSISITTSTFKEVEVSNKELIDCIRKVDRNVVSMEKNKEQIVEIINNMASIAEESAASSEEVAATTEEQSAAVEEVTASAQELNNLAGQLLNAASKFKV